MLEGLILGAVLTALPPAPFCPAYLPLPEASPAKQTRPAAPAADDVPSFSIPVAQPPAAGHASATLELEVIEDDLPSFPIAVPRPGPEESPRP